MENLNLKFPYLLLLKI
uniref:Uncharacterized protein n=1 Tax=Moniliophthora roreri TaxID=221103 RepID=A0A0W0F998_MONRR